MWTLTLTIITVALFQIASHIRASDNPWVRAATYFLIWFMALVFTNALWADLYPGVPHVLEKRWFLINALFFWGLSSLYRIWTAIRSGSPHQKTERRSILAFIIKPIASIVSFIASVLGIISFYLEFVRPHR